MPTKSRREPRKFEHPSQEAVVKLIIASSHVLQRMNDLLRPHGLTHDQYNVLRILRGVHPDGHPRLEVGRRMMSRAPDVTRLLDRLDRQGLVERGWGPENRRHSIARITDAGLELLARIDPDLLALQREVTQDLSAEELRVLARACERIG